MTKQILAVLREGWDGPKPGAGYYLDADAGLRTTLAGLTAERASKAVGGNSIAAHAHHILFSFEAFKAFITGDKSQRDWSQSWAVNEVDDGQWAKLQGDLATRYDELRAAIRESSGDEAEGGALAAAAHLAYHVGAIRQKLLGL